MRGILGRVRAPFALLTCTVLAAVPVLAQRGGQPAPPIQGLRAAPAPGFAAIAGIVDDSLRGGALMGASVVVIGTSLRATTDPGGFFRIDSIPPGEVTLVVMHPMLDTLSLTITTQRFPVTAGRLQEIALSTPSMALFRDKLCPRGGVATRNGILAGRVDEADKDGPIVNAIVSLVYVDPASGSPIQRLRTVRTRNDGMYIICGLPETIVGTVQAAVGAVSSSEVAVVTKDQFLATTSFLLSTAPRVDSVARGTAILTGRVTNAAGTPMKDAQVAVEGGTAIGITGEDGTFSLGALPSGTTSAVIRKIGFAPAFRTVNLRAAEPARISVALAEGGRTLPAVTVTGKLEIALKRVGFSDRKAFGSRSSFLSPEDIAKQNPVQLTDLFRMMPGFKVRSGGMGVIVEASRTSGAESNAGCVNVFVDRTPFQQMSPGDLDGAFPVGMIGAIESYASPSETPAEFRMAGRSCATIVAWTKMKLSQP